MAAAQKPKSKPSNAPQKKPAPKSGGTKGGAKNKKPSAKELEEARRKALLSRAYALGFFTLLLAALALIAGQNIWLDAHNLLWGFFGLPLVLWAAFSFYCCSVWMRGNTLSTAWVSLLSKALMILFFGCTVFLLTHSKDVLEFEDAEVLINSVFYEEMPSLGEIAGNGGYISAALAVWIARACGRTGALIVSLLLVLGSAPLAFSRLGESLTKAVANWSERERISLKPDKPEKPEKENTPKIEKQKKQKSNGIDDDLAELERLERAFGAAAEPQSKGLFGRPKGESAPADVLPGTVMNLDPLQDAAGENTADEPKRKKGKQPEDDAARAAISAALDSAALDNANGERTDYQPPPLSCLAPPRSHGAAPDRGEEELIAGKLVYTLESFGVQVELVGRSRGPAVTRYELRPAEGVKISKITSLSDDIALRLAATKVRIEAPIPGKPAVGVEVPNRVRAVVSMRELVDSEVYRKGVSKSKLTVALGKDIVGDFVCADLAKLPHLLIAGTTGSGKSVCMNSLIVSMLYNASPNEVKLLMVDPKQVEFNVYRGIPHLLVPVVTDPLKAAGALGWAVNEMEKRYTRISEQNVRDLDSYNNIAAMQDDLEHMPKIVIFIDELSDLMMVAPSDVEDSIQRLTQKGRAAGIHLVVATQRPSVDVITGVIKSNLPGRIALSVASQIDSRTIINSAGAEQLLGNGDMLFSLNGGNNAVRVQGCFVSDPEVQKVVNFVKSHAEDEEGYDNAVLEEIERNAANAGRGKKKGGMDAGDGSDDGDPMLPKAIEVVVAAQMASTTMLQKKLSLGYARASRLMDMLEEKGVVGPPEGAKPRKVLISHAQWQEYLVSGSGEIKSEG